MNQLYEKRSVGKDGLPKERNTYFVGWDEDGRIIILHACLFDGEKFEVDEPDEPQVGAQPDWYLVPLSERAVEERAIAFNEWLAIDDWRHIGIKGEMSRFEKGRETSERKPSKELFALFQQQQCK